MRRLQRLLAHITHGESVVCASTVSSSSSSSSSSVAKPSPPSPVLARSAKIAATINASANTPWQVRWWDPAYVDDCVAASTPEIMGHMGTGTSPADLFAYQLATRGASASCIEFQGRVWTWGDCDALSNRVAHWALSLGLKLGDSIALLMKNRPEYMPIWLGLHKIGCRTFLINPSLRSESLLYSLRLSGARVCVFGWELATEVSVVQAILRASIPEEVALAQRTGGGPGAGAAVAKPDSGLGMQLLCYNYDGTQPLPASMSWAVSFHDTLQQFPVIGVAERDTAHARGAKPSDPFIFIYTSGTTGMPKAALVDSFKMTRVGVAWQRMLGVSIHDRWYTCLPLCHSSATIIGYSVLLRSGCTLVLSAGFSASGFWSEVYHSRATIIQYIGELARYLLAQPVRNETHEKGHRVRWACGNGLAADIWEAFRSRFAVPHIAEFYAMTEGVGSTIATTNRVGCVGWLGVPAVRNVPGKTTKLLVRMADDQTTPLRDPRTGLCLPSGTNQPGEFLAVLPPGTTFVGYTDAKANESKVLTDVATKGDRWMRTGDLLRYDEEGYLYFVDRMGDTFRWKGENTSTNEVAQALLSLKAAPSADGGSSSSSSSSSGPERAFQEVNVYGVKVFNHGGRAGMACVVPNPGMGADVPYIASSSSTSSSPEAKTRLGLHPTRVLAPLAAHVLAQLPHYARPLFVRVTSVVEVTDTMKHRKVSLATQGFDPATTSDEQLYFFNGTAYVPLTQEIYQALARDQIRI